MSLRARARVRAGSVMARELRVQVRRSDDPAQVLPHADAGPAAAAATLLVCRQGSFLRCLVLCSRDRLVAVRGRSCATVACLHGLLSVLFP
ncbi:hypothetical protein V6N13_069030 [Hibiscus sabdariffa]|uniref:Uncharacterized protein n=1 Tax=Hibiscus sabdariffa TaxID=183260 RepID=A0ABR2QPS4_9ROSI